MNNMTVVIKTDGSGNVVSVRYVGNDGATHPFGEFTELTNGDKQSLKNIVEKIIKHITGK